MKVKGIGHEAKEINKSIPRKKGGATGDSPLIPVTAMQMARLCYYAYVTRDGNITMGDTLRDAVYSVAAFWVLYATGLMSERSVQLGLVVVLVSWCISTVFWSAVVTNRKMSAKEQTPQDKKTTMYMGILVNAAVFAATPAVILRYLD